MTATKTYLTGNTYPVKDQLKALGCRWDAERKQWYATTDEMAAKARVIICGGNRGAAPTCSPARTAPAKCVVCGKAPVRDARGYVQYGTKILRSGECGDCYEERKMGY